MTDPFIDAPGPRSTPAGWFPDPLGRHEHRWYNGTTWTADVADGGQRRVDPFGAVSTGRPGSTGSDGANSNGIAIAALTCGIISITLAWMPIIVVVGFVLAVLAIIFGIRGLRRSREVGKGGGAAITGIVTGIVGILLSIIGVVFSVIVVNEVVDFMEPGPVRSEVVSCALTDGALVIDARLTNESNIERDYTIFGLVFSPRELDSGDLVTQLFDVEPGQVVEFQLRRSWSGGPGTCETQLVVQGPFPFGLEMDRTNGTISGRVDVSWP